MRLSRRTKLLDWSNDPPTSTSSGTSTSCLDGGGGSGSSRSSNSASAALLSSSSSSSIISRRQQTSSKGGKGNGNNGGGEDSPFDEPPLDKTHVSVATQLLQTYFEEDNADTHDGRLGGLPSSSGGGGGSTTTTTLMMKKKNLKDTGAAASNADDDDEHGGGVNENNVVVAAAVVDKNDDDDATLLDIDEWEKFGSKFPRKNRYDDDDKGNDDDKFPDPPIAIDQSLSFETNSTTTDDDDDDDHDVCSEDSENYHNHTTAGSGGAAAAVVSGTAIKHGAARAGGGVGGGSGVKTTGTGTTTMQQQQHHHSPNTVTTTTTCADDDDVDDLFANTGCTNLFPSFGGTEMSNGFLAKAAAASTTTACQTIPMSSAEAAAGGGVRSTRNKTIGEKSGDKNTYVSPKSQKTKQKKNAAATTLTPEDVYNRLTEFHAIDGDVPGSNMLFCQQDNDFFKTSGASDGDMVTPFTSRLCNSKSYTDNTKDDHQSDGIVDFATNDYTNRQQHVQNNRTTKLTKRTTAFVSFDQRVNVVVTPSQEDIDDLLGDNDNDSNGDGDDDDEDDVPLSPFGQEEPKVIGTAAGCGTPVDFQNAVFDSFDDLQSKLSSVMEKVVSSTSYCEVFESSTSKNENNVESSS